MANGSLFYMIIKPSFQGNNFKSRLSIRCNLVFLWFWRKLGLPAAERHLPLLSQPTLTNTGNELWDNRLSIWPELLALMIIMLLRVSLKTSNAQLAIGEEDPLTHILPMLSMIFSSLYYPLACCISIYTFIFAFHIQFGR